MRRVVCILDRVRCEMSEKCVSKYDKEFTGNYPRYSGAISEVTGGPPEDINEMPVTKDPAKEGPTYDGSEREPS